MLMRVIVYLCYLIDRVLPILRHDTKLPVLSASTGNDTINLIKWQRSCYILYIRSYDVPFKGPISI